MKVSSLPYYYHNYHKCIIICYHHYYKEPIRKCLINYEFATYMEYTKQVALASVEEFIISLSAVAKNAESLSKRLLKIDESHRPRFHWKAPSSSQKPDSNNEKPKVITSHGRPPSPSDICETLRKNGIPYAIHVEVNILPLVNTWVDFKDNKKKFKSYNNNDEENYSKKNIRDDDGDEDVDRSCDVQESEEMKLLLKFPTESRGCPSGCESFQKGDCWALWSCDSSILSSQQIISDLGLSNDCIKQIEALKLNYLDDCKKGYPYPFAYGILWKDIWLVRSLWYNISDKGMLGIVNLDGSIKIPFNVKAKLPYGKSKGPLDKLFSGIRLNGDLISLTAIDLLLTSKGAILKQNFTKNAPKMITPTTTPQDEKTRVLTFDDLLKSAVFNTMLKKPTATSTIKENEFPTILRDVINPIMRDVMTEFNLNADQRAVVVRVSKWFEPTKEGGRSDDNIILVHGIFGSGKSHLLAAICVFIKRLSSTVKGENIKILLSANTNVAVDRIMKQLALLDTTDVPTLARVGCVAKIDKTLRKHLVLMSSDRMAAEREIKRINDSDPELLKLLAATKSLNFAEQQRSLAKSADVCGLTCASATNPFFLSMEINFPILILDEASQMLESTSLLPISAGRPMFMIIVGDPLQLPPTMASATTEKEVTEEQSYLERTLFDRLYSNSFRVTMLRTQYRCHPAIASICSDLFYEGKVIHGVTADDRTLHSKFKNLHPIVAMHCQGQEQRRFDSYINETEANYIKELVNFFRNSINDESGNDRVDPIPTYSIGVICLYKAQSYVIANLINNNQAGANKIVNENLIISTVDAFQGSEMDIIIIASTRTFLTDFIENSNRINVAISRARRCVIVVGSMNTLERSSLWNTVIKKAGRIFGSVEELGRSLQ